MSTTKGEFYLDENMNKTKRDKHDCSNSNNSEDEMKQNSFEDDSENADLSFTLRLKKKSEYNKPSTKFRREATDYVEKIITEDCERQADKGYFELKINSKDIIERYKYWSNNRFKTDYISSYDESIHQIVYDLIEEWCQKQDPPINISSDNLKSDLDIKLDWSEKDISETTLNSESNTDSNGKSGNKCIVM